MDSASDQSGDTGRPTTIESDSLLAAIVRSSQDAIISKDLESVIMTWNPAATRIFGFSAEEMIGRSILKLIPDDRHHEEDMIRERVKAGEQIDSFETMRLTAWGTLVPVSVTISPVRDGKGDIIGASQIARDLTTGHALDAELQDSRQRFQLLADNMSQFAWIADADGPIYWYNRRWYEYTGTDFEQMQGWGWQAVHHPDHVERVVERFKQSLDSGKEWEDTFPLRGADGSYRWFLSRAMPIRNEDGDVICWFGTNTDITEERQQREQIRLLMREVNHRSKNMLSMIQALARRTAPSDHPEFVERFEARIQALAANQDLLINGEWSGAQMKELVRTQLYYVEDLIGKRIEIDGPSLLIKPGPAETLGMALHELATNAAKYGALSNDTGRISIDWSVETQGDNRHFAVRWRESGGPPVKEPDHHGFGSTVINRIPAMSLEAEVASNFDPDGFSWTMRCALGRIVDGL